MYRCDRCREDANCMDCPWMATMQRLDEDWALSRYEQRIATDARLDAELRRAEAGYLREP